MNAQVLGEAIAATGLVAVPVVALLVVYLIRRLQSQERIKAIEKGVPIPFELLDPRERAARTRRWGIALVAGGLGIVIFSLVVVWAERDRDALSAGAFGAIPILIGLGLLYDYRLRSKELDAQQQPSSGGSPLA